MRHICISPQIKGSTHKIWFEEITLHRVNYRIHCSELLKDLVQYQKYNLQDLFHFQLYCVSDDASVIFFFGTDFSAFWTTHLFFSDYRHDATPGKHCCISMIWSADVSMNTSFSESFLFYFNYPVIFFVESALVSEKDVWRLHAAIYKSHRPQSTNNGKNCNKQVFELLPQRFKSTFL